MKQNTLPPPSRGCTQIRPPAASTTFWAIASPMPVPGILLAGGRAREHAEDPLRVRRGDADAVVGDLEAPARALARRGDADLGLDAGRDELDARCRSGWPAAARTRAAARARPAARRPPGRAPARRGRRDPAHQLGDVDALGRAAGVPTRAYASRSSTSACMRSPPSRASRAARAASGGSAAPWRLSSSARKPETAVSDWRRSCETTDGEALELGVGALELRGAPHRARPLARELLDRLVQVGDVRAGEIDDRLRAAGDRGAEAQPAVEPALRRARASTCRLSPGGMCSSRSANATTFAAVLGVQEVQVRARESSSGVQPIVRSQAALTQRRRPRRRRRPAGPGTARTDARRGRLRRRRVVVGMAAWTRPPARSFQSRAPGQPLE